MSLELTWFVMIYSYEVPVAVLRQVKQLEGTASCWWKRLDVSDNLASAIISFPDYREPLGSSSNDVHLMMFAAMPWTLVQLLLIFFVMFSQLIIQLSVLWTALYALHITQCLESLCMIYWNWSASILFQFVELPLTFVPTTEDSVGPIKWMWILKCH